MVLREFDRRAVEKKGIIRLKGTGWLAGFPIRNRQIQFRGPKLFEPDMAEGGDEQGFALRGCPDSSNCHKPGNCPKFQEYPYPRTDYLGPDIDVGFRLGAHSHPGLMVASMELAELLGKIPKSLQQVRGTIVGWQVLKGVWDGNPYPVVWVTLPENWDTEYEGQFTEWSKDEKGFVKKWLSDSKTGLRQIKHLAERIDTTRSSLPESLGVVAPYIVGDPESNAMPKEHDLIWKIIKSLYLGDRGPQGGPADKPSDGPLRDRERAAQLFAEGIDPEDPPTPSSILFRKFVF